MAELDVKRFHERIEKLHSSLVKHRTIWANVTAFSLHRGPVMEEEPYLKSAIVQEYLFGYELIDTITLLTLDGDLYVLTTKKKCDFLEAATKIPKASSLKAIHLLHKSKGDNNVDNIETLLKAIPKSDDGKRIVGCLTKEAEINTSGIVGAFEAALNEADNIELVDNAPALSFLMSTKDEEELDLVKKSSVLSNKVMKHACVAHLEEIIDAEKKITHEEFSAYIEEILEEPSKINLKVPKEDVSPCYNPIVQSGGVYDIKVSAASNSDQLTYDIIIVSMGARYKSYCSNIARTFLVDPPKKVSETYEHLLAMQEACTKAMRPGKPFKNVFKAAVNYLQDNNVEHLIQTLPKNLGFSIGMDFRDANLTLSPKNNAPFKAGMTFSLVCGFHNVPLSLKDRASTPKESAVKSLENYSLLLADMVTITQDGVDVLTKMGKNLTDVSYTINEEDEDDDDEVDAPDAPDGDAALARRMAKDTGGQRVSARLAKDNDAQVDVADGIAERERKQIALMTRRNEERIRELARANAKKRGTDGESDKPEELEAYQRTRDYPDKTLPNQVKVDMANQCVILPICGNPVPFHVSTIKNVVLPDPDNATYLRINFYTAGMAVGKDAPLNTAKLVGKYAPYASFIRELTFRSLDSHNLTQAFRMISELRKREKQKELRAQEEADLVEQEKLIRTKNERVPRLSDLTMRPVFAGRKTQGNLEAHSNGMRFTSTRSEVVDIMYSNIKYAIFQPCENEIMVLIHFHLKNPIMIGKKRQKDVQFFTEVVDASQTVDAGRRSMYDPDEMDDEQRERQLRKRLNQAFKDFCKKVDAVAKKNNYEVEFDIPYRDLGFTGNPHKEMVFVQPTLNCLLNLTETPFFVVDLSEVDHVHFERVTYMSKAFDCVLINKDFTKMPWRIDMIDNNDKDAIQEWLTDMELTYTQGPMNLNWKQIMQTIAQDDRFYMNTEEDEVTEKEAGWEFLRLYGREDEEDEDEDEDDSEFGDDPEEDDDNDDESGDEDDEGFDSEEEDESDFDADEELEEEGLDWDEMEKQAIAEDRRRGREGDKQEEEESRKKPKRGSAIQKGGSATKKGGREQQRQQKKRR